jgi:hypothetical protein
MCKKKYKKYNLSELGDELVEWMKKEENVWLKGFAISKEFPTSYFSRYKKQNKYFAEKLAIAKDIQESKLVQGVLGRKYSPSFVKFILKNEAGWKDKIEETIKEEVPSIQFVLAEKKVPEESGKDTKQKKNKNQFKLFNEDK